MLELFTDFIVSVCSLSFVLVPVIVMGIFTLVIRLVLHRY